MVVPVIRDGEARFVLSANLRSHSFDNVLAGPALPENLVGSVLDRKRIILARSRRPDEFVGKLATKSLRKEIDRASNSFFFARSIEGHEVYSAFMTSPLSGWTVAVGAPGEVVAGAQRRSLLAVSAGGLIALAATLGLAALLIGGTLRRQAMEQRLMALERRATRRAPVERCRRQSSRHDFPAGGGCRRHCALSLCQRGAGWSGIGVAHKNAEAGGDELAQLIHPDDRAAWTAAFTMPADAEPSHLEVRAVPDGAPDGGSDGKKVRWLRVMARPSPQADAGGGKAWDGVALDVTDLKEIQDRLTGALEESQTLLSEVHHRVKNNLQVVWSLVQLEAMQINHPAARARMEIIGQRINVMGRIHEQIYAHKEFTRIDFTLQLRALSERLTGACGQPEKIELVVTGERLFCSLDTAIPLALIANELVSNAVGHAFPAGTFPAGKVGTIRIDLRGHAEGAVMTVADNGVGLSGEENGGKGLGMRLVKALAGQLGASMTVDHPKSLSSEPSAKYNPDPGGGTEGTRVTIIVPGPWYADD